MIRLFHSRDIGMVQHTQIIKCNNRSKDKNHMIISIEPEKVSHKIQHPFMIKALMKPGIQGIYLSIIKAIYMTRLQTTSH
jgi:hypothetical protein